MDDSRGVSGDISLCAHCSARLSHDQRYCVECGIRRGDRPAGVAAMIGAIHERGVRAVRPRPTATPSPSRAAWVPAITMPTPRAAAAGVLAMLAFGVLVGSFGQAGLQSLASSQVLVAVPRPGTRTTAAPATDAASTDSSGGGGTTTVITQTVLPPATATPAQTSSAATPSQNPASAPANSGGGGGASQNLYGLPPIHHVFLIVLSDQGFGQTFAPTSQDHYLSKTLVGQGELVTSYYAVAGSPLANRIALISGQGPTPQTTENCPVYGPIKPGTRSSGEQVVGAGCVYPSSTKTLVDELTAAHHTWKAYVESIDTTPNGQQASCRHPQLGATDSEHAPRVTDPYVTWSNPFVYFTSMTSGTDCLDNDVGLDALQYDLRTGSQAPSVSFILPNACHAGSDEPCSPRAPAGLAPADAFVRSIVTEIEKSSAYKDNGLIAITFDEAAQSGPHADSSACCNTPAYPNLPTPTATTTSTSSTASTPGVTSTSSGTVTVTATTATGTATTAATTAVSTTTTSATTSTPPTGPTGQTTPIGGGGQVGLLLISPCVKPGSKDLVDYYNHYSLLATIENLFTLKRLGYAGNLELPVFDAAIFNRS